MIKKYIEFYTKAHTHPSKNIMYTLVTPEIFIWGNSSVYTQIIATGGASMCNNY